MQYTCPNCGAIGGDNNKTYRDVGYWCHVCHDPKVRMKPSNNGKILPESEVIKHNKIIELNGE